MKIFYQYLENCYSMGYLTIDFPIHRRSSIHSQTGLNLDLVSVCRKLKKLEFLIIYFVFIVWVLILALVDE